MCNKFPDKTNYQVHSFYSFLGYLNIFITIICCITCNKCQKSVIIILAVKRKLAWSPKIIKKEFYNKHI